jgi:hypothetical protein
MHEPLSIFTKIGYEHIANGSTYHFSRTDGLRKTQERLQDSLSVVDIKKKCKC